MVILSLNKVVIYKLLLSKKLLFGGECLPKTGPPYVSTLIILLHGTIAEFASRDSCQCERKYLMELGTECSLKIV